MDLIKKLLDMAREATGDPDVIAAGGFRPKGLGRKRTAGATAGAVVGTALGGDIGGDIGAWGGDEAARNAGGTRQGLPPVVVLAASPSKLYLLAASDPERAALSAGLFPFGTLERQHLLVKTKRTLITKTATITDRSSGRTYQLTAERFPARPAKSVLDLLDADDPQRG